MSEDEELSASEVGRLCGHKTITTVHRWSKEGVLFNGERIKLPRKRVGGSFLFYRQDVEDFLRRLN